MMLEGTDWVDDFVAPGGQLIAKRKVRQTLPGWCMRCATGPFVPLLETQVSSFEMTRGCLTFFLPGGGCHVESVSEGASLYLSIVEVTYTRTHRTTELFDGRSETPWFTVVEPAQ